MPDHRDDIWRALSDPRRRRILDVLRRRPHTTGEVCARFPDLSRAAVIKHLAALGEVRLVTVRRDGRLRWNELNALPLRTACERWLEPYAERWSGALTQLKTHAESVRADDGKVPPPEERAMARKKKPSTISRP